MSHITKMEMDVEMKDRSCILKAASILGCKALENANARYWNGQYHKGEIVLQHPDSPYDVALNRDKNGVYQPEADFFGGHIQRVYGVQGKPYGKLAAAYQAEKNKKLAKALGHTIYETVDQKTGVITHKVVINNG